MALFLAGRWTTKLNQRSQRKTDLAEKTELPHEPKEKSARKSATTGNRTRVSPVAGEYSVEGREGPCLNSTGLWQAGYRHLLDMGNWPQEPSQVVLGGVTMLP